MEEVEQSGRRMVGEVQQGVERSGRRVGLNSDRRSLLVCISSLSPDMIVRLSGSLVRELTASLTCCLWLSLSTLISTCLSILCTVVNVVTAMVTSKLVTVELLLLLCN